MNHFDNPNFDIAEYINFPGLEKLNRIALYLDYGISTTIKKQMPNITVNDEKLYAKELLNNYLKGDMHSFTSKNNIRNNIYTIGNKNLINLFLKTMIEKHAYNILIRKMQGSADYSDQCANYITNRIGKKHYSDIIEWLTNDFDNIEEIISNYVDLFYKRDVEERLDFEKLTEKSQDTELAIKFLSLEVE